MIPFQAMVAAEHLEDLRREAAARRLAREVELARSNLEHPAPSGSRRALAQLAVVLSRAAAETARRLDPARDDGYARRDAFTRDRLDVWARGQ